MSEENRQVDAIEQTKEMIKVMQAFVDGKKIQYRAYRDKEWIDIDNPGLWNWCSWEFRVKPEPRVFYINEYNDKQDRHVVYLYETREKADAGISTSSPRVRCTRLVEDLTYDRK